MLKIALINNMNNNFFSLLRFLRAKNIDAHLFQVDALDAHFHPQCDSFDDLKPCDYFHEIASISFRNFFRLPLSPKMIYQLKKLKTDLKKFDIIIASGGLAILDWIGINIDIFIPHGGDLYQAPFLFDYCHKKHFPYPLLMKRYIKYQRNSIAKARAVVALGDIDGHMNNALVNLKKNWINFPIPMVYPLPDVATGKWDFLNQYDFIAFSHTRQAWKTALDSKGNDRALHAFARFVKIQSHYKKPKLVLFEYGPDVLASKELIDGLGISKYVCWMPAMQRKFIYEGLKKASLTFDLFHDDVVTFGGVTFEAFSCSKPVIGNARLKHVEVTHSLPLIHASSEEEIFNIFMDYNQNQAKYIEHGAQSKKWFDENVGSGLVDKYIELIKYMMANKSISLENRSFNLPSIQEYISHYNHSEGLMQSQEIPSEQRLTNI